MLISRLRFINIYACQSVVEPCQTAAEHRVIAGIPAVPPLPCGRRALFNPPAEARVVLLVDYLVCQFIQSVPGKHLEKPSCPEDTCIKMFSVFIRKFCPERFHNICVAFLRHTHMQGEHISAIIPIGLCLRIVIFLMESGLHTLGYFPVFLLILRLAEHSCRL